jgi:hypothetical protein
MVNSIRSSSGVPRHSSYVTRGCQARDLLPASSDQGTQQHLDTSNTNSTFSQTPKLSHDCSKTSTSTTERQHLTMSTAARRRLMRDFKVRHPHRTTGACITPYDSNEAALAVCTRLQLTLSPTAHANRPSRWSLRLPHRRQCYDLVRTRQSSPHVYALYAHLSTSQPIQPLTIHFQERSHNWSHRHAFRRRHLPPRHALR